MTGDPLASFASAPSPISDHTDESDLPTVAGPPLPLLALLGVELFVCAGLFFFGSRLAHGVGYVIGAVAVASTAVAYRAVDRKRRLSPRYVIRGGLGVAVTAALVAGILLAVAHSYFFFSETTVEQ